MRSRAALQPSLHQCQAADAAAQDQGELARPAGAIWPPAAGGVSLDHHTQALHEAERGPRGWVKTVAGLDWLNGNGFRLAIAADLRAGERERRPCGLRRLIKERGWRIDAANPCELALLPNARRARRA